MLCYKYNKEPPNIVFVICVRPLDRRGWGRGLASYCYGLQAVTKATTRKSQKKTAPLQSSIKLYTVR